MSYGHRSLAFGPVETQRARRARFVLDISAGAEGKHGIVAHHVKLVTYCISEIMIRNSECNVHESHEPRTDVHERAIIDRS